MSSSKRPCLASLMAAGIVGLGPLSACTGAIAEGPEWGKGASGNGPGNNNNTPKPPPNNEVPEVVDPSTGKPCSTDQFTGTRIWRITDEQYANAISDLLPGIKAPDISTPGRNGTEFVDYAELLPVNSALLNDLRTSVDEVAKKAIADLPGLLGCQPGASCIDGFIDKF